LKVSNIEQTAAAKCIILIRMTITDHWTELLACPECGRSGPARLSQPENQPFELSVEAIPPGFKVVRLEFGKVFYCEVCNQPADTRNSCPQCGAKPSLVRQMLDSRTGGTERMFECRCAVA
jgi:hypothetical protein